MKREIIGSRRAFIKGAAFFGGLAVLFRIGGGPGISKPNGPPPEPETSGQGYRLTQQVKKYYETARA